MCKADKGHFDALVVNSLLKQESLVKQLLWAIWGSRLLLVTSLSFIIVFILRSEALIQNVDHFSAEVYDEQRKSSLRHAEWVNVLAANFLYHELVTAVVQVHFLLVYDADGHIKRASF